ncbi:hypothetical protein [Candidatus Magnetominusculus xianensis]|uniref:Uncharacterized protein n=1 Tax=Candidatus Magnetominusculus xianensis TaxID=1748249 RepID=A0ABR5SDE5_9BACT|nr:hypothetical protein [Candidatus Magnetominusculus xianensis]KWT82940.1 hypothetical protein ASN18_2301 [Candidatus Magnetominusculus xianensis]
MDKWGIVIWISDLLHLTNVSFTSSEAAVILLVFAFVINVPFGYFRARQKVRSLNWFMYIHLPIPFVILMRSLVHLDYKFIPLSLAASVLGQYVGGKL